MTSSNLAAHIISQTSLSLTIAMNPDLSLDSSSIETDIFYVERSSEEGSPARNDTNNRQLPIVPASLKDLNLPPNPFKVLATMAMIRADEEYGPNCCSHLSRLQFRRLQWMWALLKAGRQRKQQRMMPQFFLRLIRDNSRGIFLPAKPLNPMSRDMYQSLHEIHFFSFFLTEQIFPLFFIYRVYLSRL